jgi:hypothetical protein
MTTDAQSNTINRGRKLVWDQEVESSNLSAPIWKLLEIGDGSEFLPFCGEIRSRPSFSRLFHAAVLRPPDLYFLV